ncbi:hypothetical protein MASSI9I_20176 [Massilia sp. 9I]|nr:hypothetical protein MASSI9I_20176 [Massilia sp. 9I]
MGAAQAQEPDSRWQLRVFDLRHLVKVEATIRFTNEPADSCMGGAWKRVLVESRDVRADEFLPLNEPLAYLIEGNKLTLGRTRICDGYLFLSGTAGQSMITGSYDAVGWGRKPLGSFVLGKVQD